MHCTHCGHELGIGRFCTNCGQPIPGRHESVPTAPAAPTAPVPSGPPPSGPPPSGPPPPTPPPPAPPAPLPVVVATTGPLGPPPGPPAAHHRATWLVWAAVAAVLLVVVAVGLVVLLGGDDESAKDPARSHARATTEPATGGSSDRPTRGAGTSSASAGGPAGDLLAEVGRIRVPGTAPASTDARTGAPVTFGAAHLTDGDTTTCWRVAGDASGTALTIIFTRPVTLTEVGMVNGYAKSYPGYDGYQLNRKVLAVRWVLDDGTEVAQRLTVDRRMQTVPVDAGAGATTTLRLEIDQVSPPGPGEFGKDFTAISELHLVGSPS